MTTPPTPVHDIDAAIAKLTDLTKADLQVAWRRAYGNAAPDCLSRDLLARGVAYRLQEKKLGGLNRRTAALLDKIADGAPVPVQRDVGRLKPGTLLVREWQGSMHRVMVLADGFAWNGQTLGSLSEIARAITGTRWNGPAFFGLRRKRGETPDA